MTAARDRLIVALDFDNGEEARGFVAQAGDTVSFYKIGLVLFMAAGPSLVRELLDQGKKIFLDLKMADIDQTVRRAVANIPKGVELTTIYGGAPAIKAASEGSGSDGPAVLGVTWLSSAAAGERREGFAGEDLGKHVSDYADMALAAGADGLVASGPYVAMLRQRYLGKDQKPLLVAPGIRPAGSQADEHKRTLSPGQAIAAGADFIVVGRPITQAKDPALAVRQIVEEMEGADSAVQHPQTPP